MLSWWAWEVVSFPCCGWAVIGQGWIRLAALRKSGPLFRDASHVLYPYPCSRWPIGDMHHSHRAPLSFLYPPLSHRDCLLPVLSPDAAPVPSHSPSLTTMHWLQQRIDRRSLLRLEASVR